MKKTELEKGIEALLFFVGENLSVERLTEVFEVEAKFIEKAVAKLNTYYLEYNSGLEIIEVNGGFQMCTTPETLVYIQRYKQKPLRKFLTQALLETLAIVAYSQPITRAQIEEIRGVRCEHAIAKLIEYQLIEEVGRLNVIGRPLLFGTTNQFLRHFGYKSLQELPKIKEELVERFKQEIEQEMNYREDS
jgi:segregation and condensation protein B